MDKNSIATMFQEAGWKTDIKKPSHLHAFQVIGTKKHRGLSVVAGACLYSNPQCISAAYSAVEVGFLLKGLRYCRPGSPWFVGDVEGYVEEHTLRSMIEHIMDLNPNKRRRCPDCGKMHAMQRRRCLRCNMTYLSKKIKDSDLEG